jgi:transmembrane sensor
LENKLNDIEDFLMDESFRSWVNNPTPELDRHWKLWIEVNQTKIELVNQSIKIIQSLNFEEFQADLTLKERILEKVRLEIKPQGKHLTFLNTWYKVAAVLILALGIGALIRFNASEKNLKEPLSYTSDRVQKSNAPGVKSKHILSDGSTVFLNSGSSIEYPKTFDSNVRVVKLKGEAFFQVSKDMKRPFKVLVDDFEVVVLGTKFNVNSNLNSPEVALVEGKVMVKSGRQDASLELSPGQMATFNKNETSFTSTAFNIEYVTGWKDGYLMFRDATFDEVIEKLHAWYGKDISVLNKPKSGGWSYTADFKNESLESVLLNMSTLRSFDYVIKNDSLIISF